MSIASEITRISGNVADALSAISDKGVTVPAGSTSDDLADLIDQIVSASSVKNTQVYAGRQYITGTANVATNLSVTVTKTGTYNISWVAWRSSASLSRYSTQLYKNRTAVGTEITSLTDGHGMCIQLVNQQLSAGDALVVHASAAASTGYGLYVSNLIVQEV